MLSNGKDNRKLGSGIWNFGLPTVKTCPGKSNLCVRHCYARKGMCAYAHPKWKKNLKISYRRDFATRMVIEVLKTKAKIVRVHVGGDFYSPQYVDKWIEIAESCPLTLFVSYTRSWRDESIRQKLDNLGSLPNWRSWLSCDKETGQPKGLGRVAYMSVADNDAPDFPADLIFRVKRDTVLRKLNQVQVCPHETGLKRCAEIQCKTCRICY